MCEIKFVSCEGIIVISETIQDEEEIRERERERKNKRKRGKKREFGAREAK